MYKYTRKECNKEIETIKRIFSGSQIMPGGWLETVTQYLHATQLMLLAQKEDKKECKHQYLLKQDHCYCVVCGKSTKPTPSPLEEIEEIEETTYDELNNNKVYKPKTIIGTKINALIRNQKKLYQLIKDKL